LDISFVLYSLHHPDHISHWYKKEKCISSTVLQTKASTTLDTSNYISNHLCGFFGRNCITSYSVRF